MEMFVYTDETSFSKSMNSTFETIGTGTLITNEPIDDIIVNEALICLENDPDLTKQDKETLLKKHFHASKNTKNAHSHFCNSINKYVKGYFKCSYFNKEKLSPFSSSRTNEDLNRLTLGISSLEMHTYKCNKINLTIEARNGFNISSAEKWFNNWLSELDKHAYNQTSYVTYYPEVKISLENKSNAGLQVLDFMLWAFNRSVMDTPETIWLKRIKSDFTANHSINDSPESGGSLHLKNGVDFPDTLFEYPISVPELKDENHQTAFEAIQKTINQLSISIPNQLIHLENKINRLKGLHKNSENSKEIIKEYASVFIRAFDTLPIYKTYSVDSYYQWSEALRAKKFAGLLLRTDLPESLVANERAKHWLTR